MIPVQCLGKPSHIGWYAFPTPLNEHVLHGRWTESIIALKLYSPCLSALLKGCLPVPMHTMWVWCQHATERQQMKHPYLQCAFITLLGDWASPKMGFNTKQSDTISSDLPVNAWTRTTNVLFLVGWAQKTWSDWLVTILFQSFNGSWRHVCDITALVWCAKSDYSEREFHDWFRRFSPFDLVYALSMTIKPATSFWAVHKPILNLTQLFGEERSSGAKMASSTFLEFYGKSQTSHKAWGN